jgi:Ca2+-binding EF-hand superfamily protein
MSKLFSSVGHESADNEKEALQKIFLTIDTDGTGSCSIEELTVSKHTMIMNRINCIAGEKQRKKSKFDSTCSAQVFLKKLFYTPKEIEEFIKLADSDQSGEVESNFYCYALFAHVRSHIRIAAMTFSLSEYYFILPESTRSKPHNF